MPNIKLIINQSYLPGGGQAPKWERTDTGFLRCRARIISTGIMPYSREEVGQVPPEVTDDQISFFVPTTEINSPHSLRSLEGAPIVAGSHVWITTENLKEIASGYVVGTPYMDGPWLSCDLLITDPATIDRIESRELTEISAAYSSDAIFDTGEYEGQTYHGRQTALRYNHIAIIPPGTGRGGGSVRIMNQEKGDKEMADEFKIVRVQLKNSRVFVNTDEAGAKAIDDEEKGSGESMEKTLANLEESNGQMAALTEENEKLKGELAVFKEQLDAAMSPETIENAATVMNQEREEASEIVENMCDDKDKKSEFKNSIIGLRGIELKKKTLVACGLKIENMSDDNITGAFIAQSSISKMHGKRFQNASISGHKIMNTMIPADGGGAPAAKTQLNKLGY